MPFPYVMHAAIFLEIYIVLFSVGSTAVYFRYELLRSTFLFILFCASGQNGEITKSWSRLPPSLTLPLSLSYFRSPEGLLNGHVALLLFLILADIFLIPFLPLSLFFLLFLQCGRVQPVPVTFIRFAEECLL